ncbi:tricalbin [Hortaea werneckii]|nr:tricalbin [Hortaea werneckii]
MSRCEVVPPVVFFLAIVCRSVVVSLTAVMMVMRMMVMVEMRASRRHAAVPPVHKAAHAGFPTCRRFGRKHAPGFGRLEACAQGDNTRADSHLLLAARRLIVDEEGGLAKLFTTEKSMVANLDAELRVSRALDPLWPALVLHYTVDRLVMIDALTTVIEALRCLLCGVPEGPSIEGTAAYPLAPPTDPLSGMSILVGLISPTVASPSTSSAWPLTVLRLKPRPRKDAPLATFPPRKVAPLPTPFTGAPRTLPGTAKVPENVLLPWRIRSKTSTTNLEAVLLRTGISKNSFQAGCSVFFCVLVLYTSLSFIMNLQYGSEYPLRSAAGRSAASRTSTRRLPELLKLSLGSSSILTGRNLIDTVILLSRPCSSFRLIWVGVYKQRLRVSRVWPLRDEAKSDAREVQLANHEVARFVEVVITALRLSTGVDREEIIVHDNFQVCTTVSQVAFKDPEDKQAGFCALSSGPILTFEPSSSPGQLGSGYLWCPQCCFWLLRRQTHSVLSQCSCEDQSPCSREPSPLPCLPHPDQQPPTRSCAGMTLFLLSCTRSPSDASGYPKVRRAHTDLIFRPCPDS